MASNDAFSVEAGIRLVEVLDGYAKVELTVEDRHLNTQNIAHGGVLMTMTDLAMGAACFSYGVPVVTMDMQYRFFHPVHPGDLVVAEGHVDKNGRTIKVTHADITVNGRIVGYASGQFHRSS